eukprot:4889069-Prymnesium_polylepis.1
MSRPLDHARCHGHVTTLDVTATDPACCPASHVTRSMTARDPPHVLPRTTRDSSMTARDPASRPSASACLAAARGTIFPAAFYSF